METKFKAVARRCAFFTLVIPLLGLAMLLGQGCATSEGKFLTPTRVEAVTKLSAYLGAKYDLQSNPERRPAYVLAEEKLEALVNSGQWDAVTVAAILSDLQFLQTEEGTLIVTGGLLFVDAISGGTQVDLKKSEYVAAVVTGSHAGLRLALGNFGTRGFNSAEAIEAQLRAEAAMTRGSVR